MSNIISWFLGHMFNYLKNSVKTGPETLVLGLAVEGNLSQTDGQTLHLMYIDGWSIAKPLHNVILHILMLYKMIDSGRQDANAWSLNFTWIC